MAKRWPLAVLLVALAAQAQPRDASWLASAAAREFRMRVAQLAVIYGDSRGIDPHGLLVTSRRAGGVQGDCADVDVVVLDGERELRREQVRACRHGGAGPSGEAPRTRISAGSSLPPSAGTP